MDFTQLPALLIAHKWFALAALLIGFAVRVLKDDTKLPTLPPRYRPALAIGLGLVAAVVDKIASGQPWKEALTWGLGTGVVAILGHVFGIDMMRDGKEISVGPLMLPPSELPTNPTSLTAKKATTLLAILLFVTSAAFATSQTGCAWFEKHEAVIAQDLGKIARCVYDHEGEKPEAIALTCGVANVGDVVGLLSAKRASFAKANCPQPPESDGGVRSVNVGPGK